MSKLHIDATLVAAQRMAELQASLDNARSLYDAAIRQNNELNEKLRAAEAVRDDARAASNRDLERRRVAEAEVAELQMRLRVAEGAEDGPSHSRSCGTAFRGCAPDCAFAAAQDAEARNRIEECACSPKYRELAPGVHAGYCPLKGMPMNNL